MVKSKNPSKTKVPPSPIDFMQKYKKETEKSLQTVTQKQEENKSSIDTSKKDVEYIDINLMDDAPAEWNFFPRLKEEQPTKFAELKMSIYNNGVLDPVIVWKKPDGRYMKLAGHSRVDACFEILEDGQDDPEFNGDKYRFIRATVYDVDEIDERKAKEFIIDTNYVQREYGPRMKMTIIKKRMGLLDDQRYTNGMKIEQVARSMGIKKSTIYDNLAIANNVIDPLKELYFNDKLKFKSVLKFASMNKETQQLIWDKHREQITDTRVKMIKKTVKDSPEEIEKIFEAEEVLEEKRVEVSVPVNRLEEFNKLVKEFLKG